MPPVVRVAWTKRVHEEELDLARQLKPELKGAFDTIRDLYCRRSADLPDDDGFLAGNLGVSAQKARALKMKLSDLGHIKIVGNKIQCDLAHQDYCEAADLIEQKRQAGKQSQRVQRARRQEDTRNAGFDDPERAQEIRKSSKSSSLNKALVRTPPQPTTRTNTKKITEVVTCRDQNDGVQSIGSILANSTEAPYARTLSKHSRKSSN